MRLISRARDAFARYVAQNADPRPIARFRLAFAAVWLLYDACDLALDGTAGQIAWYAPFGDLAALRCIQWGLVASECLLLLGVAPRSSAFAAASLRFLELRYFRLNDFIYAAVVAFVLSQARSGEALAVRRRAPVAVPRWASDLLVHQIAWIYACAGLLKLTDVWLSGGELFARLNWLATAFHWPYPGPMRRCVATLSCDAALAWMGACGEIALSIAIVLRAPRWLVLGLSAAIHGFAAAAANVYFFGASMFAQVALLYRPSPLLLTVWTPWRNWVRIGAPLPARAPSLR